MLCGETVHIPSGPTGSHLFVVICEPCVVDCYGVRPHIILVGITTVYPTIPYDNACLLRVGDHPFIEHDSYIYYRYAWFANHNK